jgi:hypothetical protein
VVTEIRLYFEGDVALRPGFHVFLSEIIDRLRNQRIKFKLIACDATPAEDYQAGRKKHPDAVNILLRDSEGSKIPRPPNESEFWMVQLMEAWFLADLDALEVYYGRKFARFSFNPRVEDIPKAEVLNCLKNATKDTPKGPYHKTKHAPHILERLDPTKVRNAAPNCERLFREVMAKLSP